MNMAMASGDIQLHMTHSDIEEAVVMPRVHLECKCCRMLGTCHAQDFRRPRPYLCSPSAVSDALQQLPGGAAQRLAGRVQEQLKHHRFGACTTLTPGLVGVFCMSVSYVVTLRS